MGLASQLRIWSIMCAMFSADMASAVPSNDAALAASGSVDAAAAEPT